MLSPLAICLLALQAPGQIPSQSTVQEVRPEGVFLVSSSGTQSPPGTAAPVVSPRWQQDDGGLAWIAANVAMGDSGASIVVGKELNNESVACFGTGSATPLFDATTLDANNVRVAMASRAPMAAALATYDIGGGVWQSTLQTFASFGDGVPLATINLPTTGNVIAGMVAVSEHGDRVVAAVSNASGQQHIRVFAPDGTPLASYDVTASANIRFGTIDANALRLYLGLYNGTCEIYDLSTGALQHSQSLSGTFDSHAFSADGTTFAYGNFSGLFVVRETLPGVWTQIASRFHAGSQFLGHCALSADGNTAAFEVQRYSPAYDHVEIGMFDVTTSTDLFSVSLDAPGSAFQLSASSCDISADGETAAFGTWGDEFSVTPTLQAYDRTGTQTMVYTTPGSVYSVAIDVDGDVIAAGSKAVHANTFGNGGTAWCLDAAEQTLHILGDAQLGGTLEMTSPSGATQIWLAMAPALGQSPTAFGISELSLGGAAQVFGPFAVGAGGALETLPMPSNPSLNGTAVHFQGLRVAGVPELTNKVSIRLYN